MLEVLGLDPAVEVVYRSLLDCPRQGVEDLCKQSGLAESDVRSALDRLAGLHLLRRAGQDMNELCPVDPKVSLGALLSRRSAELLREQRQLDEARTAISTLTAEYTEAQRDFLPEVAERLDGLDAVRRRLSDLAENARTECLSLMPGGAQKPDTMNAGKPLDQMALERGVAIRTIHQDSLRNDAATTQYVHWLATLGGETRTTPTLPMLLVIVDREVALVPLDPQDVRRGALVLHSEGAVTAMVMLFEQVWKHAAPWATAVSKDRHGLSAQERELLRLLAEGCTDEIAARSLGVSLRTVRRLSAGLLTRLQARSRFEAGARAVREGWV
jgi:DNA-binding CsgD family transcriptional regulator/sugar-specific transcriptional regulator TrmB